MLVTLSELRLKIDDLKKNYNDKLSALQTGSIINKIKELNGKEEILSPPFDFKAELMMIDEVSKEISRLNGLLAKANNTTFIDKIDTIQTALSKTQERRKFLDKLDTILSSSKERKLRKTDASFGSNNAYYDIIELNFDKNSLISYRDSLKQELNILEVKIQNSNNATSIEI